MSCIQVYHTESGARHRFFRVYPYMKQLRRWIKNRRKEGSKAKQSGSTKAQGTDRQKAQHPQQAKSHLPLSNTDDPGAYSMQQASPQDEGLQIGLQQSAGSIPRPAPVTHCSVPEQPGQAWLNFVLDRRRIMQHLQFPDVPVSS